MSVEVLFFDLATSSGYAAGGIRGVEAFGSFEMPRTYERIGRFLVHAERKIEALIDRFDPALIAFESPFINRRVDTIVKIRKLSGLANEVEKLAEKKEIECEEAMVDDICRHFLGRGYPRKHDEKKMATKNKCRELGWNIANDDEADALAGLSYMLACKHPESALKVTPLAAYLMPATDR